MERQRKCKEKENSNEGAGGLRKEKDGNGEQKGGMRQQWRKEGERDKEQRCTTDILIHIVTTLPRLPPALSMDYCYRPQTT